ncbi:MAG: urease accessory protein UreD [Polyangiales bacterium]
MLDAVTPRAPAVARAVVARGPRRSEVVRARSDGPLRLVCPRRAGDAAWVVTSSLGGGLVDGDDVTLDLSVGAGAVALLTTQASTKVYRGASSQRARVAVDGDGVALVVPDPVVPFAGARFTQRTDLSLSPDATVALIDVVTAGRVAYGERWSAASITSTLAVSVGERSLLVDRVRLDPARGDLASRMGRFEAFGTALLLGPRARDLARDLLARVADTPVGRRAPVVIAASPLGDGVIARVAGESIEAVTRAVRELVAPLCASVGEDPWSRRW